MATVSENLIALQTAKENIKTAIQSKGQDLTDVPFTQYADKINAIQTSGGVDRLQWVCDNVKKLDYTFTGYTGQGIEDILKGLDTKNVTSMKYIFNGATGLKELPNLDTSSVTDLTWAFYRTQISDVFDWNTSKVKTFDYCFGSSMFKGLDIDSSSATSMANLCDASTSLQSVKISNCDNNKSFYYAFNSCTNLTEFEIGNTSKVTNFSYMFRNNSKLTTVPLIDMVSCTSNSNTSNMFANCYELTNVTLKNIKANLQLGSGTSYGTKITLDSLVNTIKELWDYSSGTTTHTLTLSTTSKELIANVYVKLVDVTDEMLSQDQYAANKKPCVVCEPTDEDAMLITEYLTSKNWALA